MPSQSRRSLPHLNHLFGCSCGKFRKQLFEFSSGIDDIEIVPAFLQNARQFFHKMGLMIESLKQPADLFHGDIGVGQRARHFLRHLLSDFSLIVECSQPIGCHVSYPV
jgi:hypothetical protein